jgi:ADP-ribosylglycohydrolase/protein-tyrosine phosphatase
MAVAIAEVTATGADLLSTEALDAITARWCQWAGEAADVGAQTRAVLRAAGPNPTGADLTAAATALHQSTGRSAGNGALMRTAPVALAYLDDPDALIDAAHTIAALTHHDPEAGEACALWCLAIRHAVLHGTFDGLRAAVDTLPAARVAVWAERLDDAEARDPASFISNGWAVEALQAAWSAITRTPIPDDDSSRGVFAAQHVQLGLEAAVRGGRDTDTVAAIAGGLLGARWGASAVPVTWQRTLHGWPGLRSRDLVRLGIHTMRRGSNDPTGWPGGPVVRYGHWGHSDVLVQHPHDHGVWLSGEDHANHPPEGVEVVVSLSRRTATQVPIPGVMAADHVEVWLIDSPDVNDNPNLSFVLHEAAKAVRDLRAEGKTVLLHCVEAVSRTPTVAALYSSLITNLTPEQALDEVLAVLPRAAPNQRFRILLREVSSK